tara:strand:+ start:1229 stop:1423 length:195 start_codon:yes stop_codon:yes gene_type:complete
VKGDRLREFVRSLGHVDVVEDHRCALAPQLDFHRDQVMTAVACHHAADFGRAGERHAAEVRIPG